MSVATPNFAGLRVAAFESRRADDLARLLEKAGAVPHVSPSMREVPLEGNREAIDFANLVISGQIEIVIFLTGVGVRNLLAAIERHVDRQRFLDALSDVTTLVRGPKPLAVLRELGLKPTLVVPEPNTWREVLTTLDAHAPVANRDVAVQEYGVPSVGLVAGLEARGARVQTVRVYGWDLPLDTAPLEANLREIAAGRIDVAMFTSSPQVHNVLAVAVRMGIEAEVRAAFEQIVVASIGPSTSETLRELRFHVDLEPEHPKMGHLVQEAAARSTELAQEKRRSIFPARPAAPSGETAPASAASPSNAPLFLRACRREPVERTPIWLMRQAGRYMAEYRQVREKVSFLELCKRPELCAEVMITAVNRLGVDAAIIFADILPILEPLGFQLEFAQDEGPVIHNPVRAAADVDRVRELESMDALSFVPETVRQTRAGLKPHIPVIGFAGAPFTLASYAIEGGGSRNYLNAKSLMYRDEGAWNALLGKLSRAVARYLNAQIAAGAQAVQLFDSWVGCLGPQDYRRYVLSHTQSVIDALPSDIPVIHFGAGNPALLPALAEAGGTVMGIDWRVRLDDAWRAVGYDRAVQGNLDPLVLFSEPDEIRKRARDLLDQAGRRPGHIFNLGHGIDKRTPVENVIALVQAVQEMSGSR
jgi:uroporphyrinogen decarboxylase